jgi:outer membrane protein assembly factor BamB
MAVETLKLQAAGRELRPGDDVLSPGATLQGRYQIIKVIGLGGMGAVYQARDLHFKGANRLVALKEMIVAATDPEKRQIAAKIFAREVDTLATLSHPSILKIYDYFTNNERNYMVLEFIEGFDLEGLLKKTRDPLPVERVIDWAIQICDVLSYLHKHKPPIVFRDMKPSNIMIRFPNQIVLIDYGIARELNVRKGTMIGTEGYSPPEQYRGVASPQGDIYALGATLHHLLTCRDPRLHPPFTFHEEPPSLLNQAVPKDLEAVIIKALEYEPDKRFASADEMKAALIQCQKKASQSQEAARSLAGAESSDVKRENSTPEGASPLVADASAGEMPGEGVTPIWQFRCEDEVRSSPVMVDGIVYVGCYDNNLYALNAKTGAFHWKYATEGGIAATPCVWKDRVLIGSEDRFLYAVSARTGRILWTCPTEGRIRSSARVELEHAFFGSDDHRMYAVNANSGQVVWRFEALDAIRSSPAVGDEIVYVGSEDSHLYAVDLQTGRQRWKFRGNRAITSSPALYNGLVIFGSQDWNIYALDERSGWSVWRFRTGNVVFGSPRVVDGVVYIGSVDGLLYALDAGSGRLVWKFNAGAQIISTPAVGGAGVCFGTIGGEVISVHLKTGKERWRFRTGSSVPSSPCVSEGAVYIGSNDHHVYALPT